MPLDLRTRRTLLALSAIALVVTAVVRAWFTTNVGDGHTILGLWGVESCGAGGCQSARLDNTQIGDEVYLTGYLAVAGAFITAALAGVLVANGPVAIVVKRTRQAAMFTLGAMAAFFVVTYLFNALYGLSPDWALFVGPAAAFGVLRLAR